jgi:hypothetical protein
MGLCRKISIQVATYFSIALRTLKMYTPRLIQGWN